MKMIMWFLRKYIYSLFSCIYLFAGGFLSARHRVLISTIYEHFGLGRPKAIIPKIAVAEFLTGNPPIQLEELNDFDGNVSIIELVCLASLVKKYNAKRVFEIGTFDGRTTLNMAKNTAEDAKVFTLDLPKQQLDQTALHVENAEKKFIDKDASGLRFAGKHGGKITQLYGDSATFDYTPYLNSIDFMFVDGAHSYEYVVSDTRTALKLVKDNGVIAWHDYDTIYPQSHGLTNALNEFYLKDFPGMKHIEGTTLVYCVKGSSA